VRNCFVSLFTDRAISYRYTFQFDIFNVGLSVCVQKMVRSDLASSGVAFSLDAETGFARVVGDARTGSAGENRKESAA
jgi:pyruvate,water dikinase